MNRARSASTSSPLARPRNFFSTRSFRTKIILVMVPVAVFILLATGYLSYRLTNHFAQPAVKNNILIKTQALSKDLENFLKNSKETLLLISQEEINSKILADFMRKNQMAGGVELCGLSFLSFAKDEHLLNFMHHGEVRTIRAKDLSLVSPSPEPLLDRLKNLEPGQVYPSEIMRETYPFPGMDAANGTVSERVVRFAAYAQSESGKPGLLVMSANAKEIAANLAAQIPDKGPGSANLLAFVFNTSGRVLLWSKDAAGGDLQLPNQEYIQEPGTHGLYVPAPGSPAQAFRKIVQEARIGNSGVMDIESNGSARPDHFLGYAPVRYSLSRNSKPFVYAGLAVVAENHLPEAVAYKYLDIMFIIVMASVFIIILACCFTARFFARPLDRLARSIDGISGKHGWNQVSLPDFGPETGRVARALSNLLARFQEQAATLEQSGRDQAAAPGPGDTAMDRAWELLKLQTTGDMPGILGTGGVMDEFRSAIAKAAQVDVDVLLTGENGTGKSLAAETIHMRSQRSGGPFLVVDCEKLGPDQLPDALFGHAPGALPGDKTGRKGAFVQAHGGTLLLREIQCASQEVQKHLLRAIAARKVRPRGEDREMDTDVRLIASATPDIAQMVEQGLFRKDLYYRLKVVTVLAPALGEHLESLPVLCLYFLTRHESEGTGDKGLSPGALAKLFSHAWPGNIRELKECVDRARALAQGGLIRAEHISFGPPPSPTQSFGKAAEKPGSASQSAQPPDISQDREKSVPKAAPMLGTGKSTQNPPAPAKPGPGLNTRQKAGLAYLKKHKTVTRSLYQELVLERTGEEISPRTANYDLNGLAAQGLVQKQGKGPATKYVLK